MQGKSCHFCSACTLSHAGLSDQIPPEPCLLFTRTHMMWAPQNKDDHVCTESKQGAIHSVSLISLHVYPQKYLSYTTTLMFHICADHVFNVLFYAKVQVVCAHWSLPLAVSKPLFNRCCTCKTKNFFLNVHLKYKCFKYIMRTYRTKQLKTTILK